jgi:hypothetical protein
MTRKIRRIIVLGLFLSVAVVSTRLVFDVVASVTNSIWAAKTARSIVGSEPLQPHAAADALSRAMLQRLVLASVRGKTVRSCFLRASARETWEDRVAYCGEASRLLVVLLRSVGVPAARINLTQEDPHLGHVAVIYQSEGQWFLLRSIGESGKFLSWLSGTIHPLDTAYTARFNPRWGGYVFSNHAPLFDRISYYDFSRFTGGVMQVLLMAPPPYWLVGLLEYPERMHAAADTVFLICLLLLLRKMRLAQHRYRKYRTHSDAVRN